LLESPCEELTLRYNESEDYETMSSLRKILGSLLKYIQTS